MTAYRTILAAVDGSPTATRGLREAIRLARQERVRLVILHVVDEYFAFATFEGAVPGADLVPALRQAGRRILARAAALAQRSGVKAKPVLREIIGGGAAGPILSEAKKQRADLIVMGTHGRRGLRRMVLGSDAEQVLRSAPVPVLLVRAKP